jgi:hypothetical protein
MNVDLVFLYEHQIRFHAVGRWGGGAVGCGGAVGAL